MDHRRQLANNLHLLLLSWVVPYSHSTTSRRIAYCTKTKRRKIKYERKKRQYKQLFFEPNDLSFSLITSAKLMFTVSRRSCHSREVITESACRRVLSCWVYAGLRITILLITTLSTCVCAWRRNRHPHNVGFFLNFFVGLQHFSFYLVPASPFI